MRTRVILVTMLIVLLALPMVVHAQETEPEAVAKEQVEAVNKGDADAAQVTMAEDATVTVPAATVTESAAPAATEGEDEDEDEGTDPAAAAAADPAAQQQYTGTAETQAYLEGQAAAKANTALGECSVAGDTVTCAANYTSDALQARGIDFLEGELVVTVAAGKIQTFNFTPSSESVAKIRSAFAAPTTLPQSGGTTPTQATTYMVLAALGLLLLLAGAATYAFQRRGA
jgi:hypothetical protein